MTDDHLSKNREHLCRLQRQRRARVVRIDYMPGPDALAAIESKRGPHYPLNTNSGILDAIVNEWADLAGIKKRPDIAPMSSRQGPELSDANARANNLAEQAPRLWPIENNAEQSSKWGRVQCGARRRSDGQPCQALSVPGKRRCKWHGGLSTGPRTPQGKAKVAENLPHICS